MTDRLAIAIAQINPTVGAIADNLGAIRRAQRAAARAGADLVVFPELAMMGYPPEDMVLKAAFQKDARAAVEALAKDTGEGAPALLVGSAWTVEGALYNAFHLLDGGRVMATRLKHHLPNYGVFDEKRVFTAAPPQGPVDFRGVRLGLMICEDMWFPEIPECLAETGADILIAPHGSPYEVDKLDHRLSHAVARVKETGLPIIFVNQVGGQDELVFDGASFILNSDCSLAVQLPDWEEKITVTQWHKSDKGWTCAAQPRPALTEGLSGIYQAMMLGLRDYVTKNRFPGVILGLSGGIDSALSAAVAVDALGAEAVRCVMLPSRYTSRESLEDAAVCAAALGASYETIAIEPAVAALGATLAPSFAGRAPDVTEENIQSRLRGLILMALSNKFGPMLLTTGNKSEMSVGYATLYGDMCGGYSVLKDVYKTTVFQLARWRNETLPRGARGPSGEVIPSRIIAKPPTAELRAGQRDEDSLPPYEALDDMLQCLIEKEMAIDDIVARGHARDLVKRIEHLLYVAEYKRRQAPPGVKISSKSFGRDRRYPITNGFRDAVDLDFHRWND
ncbi:MAG: NAD+ synthase [Pseudomonadota bacterium]